MSLTILCLRVRLGAVTSLRQCISALTTFVWSRPLCLRNTTTSTATATTAMDSLPEKPPAPCALLEMPSELILKVMESCETVGDLFHLSRSCRLLSAIYKAHQTSTLASVCDNHFGPVDLAVSMTRHRLGPRDDVATPMDNCEMQALVYHDRMVTRQFERAYVKQHLVPGGQLTAIQKRRLRTGLYRVSIFLDRFQRLQFFPDAKRDFGILDEDDELTEEESRVPVVQQELPLYARWLMALSTDELLELEDVRLLIIKTMRSLYPCGYRSDIQTWINHLPYSILQSSLNTMNPMHIAYILQYPEDSNLKDDELNALMEENQAFLDEAIWCALRLRKRGVGTGYGYLVRGEGKGPDTVVGRTEEFKPGETVKQPLLGMPIEEAFEDLVGFLMMNADSGTVGAPISGDSDDSDF